MEHDILIGAYEHLASLPRAAEALHSIRKVASLVKPIMRKRGWKVDVLTEFYPSEENLLGLNVNHGCKICLRLRYAGDKLQFLPIEQVVDTMLHELSHNVHSPHNDQFHKLWDELRDDYQDLVMKGYTGEGFLSKGRRLGGRHRPIEEMRRQARASAERRKVLTKGSGQKLGGAPVLRGTDMRAVIADAARRRTRQTQGITQGCASGTQGAQTMADQASQNGFRSKAEEDDANDRAIAQALWELVQEDEAKKAGVSYDRLKSEGLNWSPENGLEAAGPSRTKSPPPYDKPDTKQHAACLPPPVTTRLKLKPPPAPSLVTPKQNQLSIRTSAHSSTSSALEAKKWPHPSLAPPPQPPSSFVRHSNKPPSTWSCHACTLVNSIDHLACDVCGSERPQHILKVLKLPKMEKLGWNCERCGTLMETKWWTCSMCGMLKESS